MKSKQSSTGFLPVIIAGFGAIALFGLLLLTAFGWSDPILANKTTDAPTTEPGVESSSDTGNEDAGEDNRPSFVSKKGGQNGNSIESSDFSADEPPGPVISEDIAEGSKPKVNKKPLVATNDGRYEATFDDLDLDMEPAIVFEDSMLNDLVRALDGETVTITGFIHGGTVYTRTDIKQFLLVRNFDCPFGGAEGVACHNIRVTLGEGIDFTVKPITVEGILRIDTYEGHDGNTWSIYTLQGEVTS